MTRQPWKRVDVIIVAIVLAVIASRIVARSLAAIKDTLGPEAYPTYDWLAFGFLVVFAFAALRNRP